MVEARLRFDDGRPEQIVRLPDRATRPRMLYQRQLHLANHLFEDHLAARNAPPGHNHGQGVWARSYARHLCKTTGCASVALYVKLHQIPDLERTLRGPGGSRRAADRPGRRGVFHGARTDRRILVRRLLIGPWEYLTDLSRAAVRGWNAFFFTPADPTPLGVVRLIVGLLLFWDLLVIGLDLHAFLGTSGWADPEALRAQLDGRGSLAWSLWLWVPDGLLRVVWVACLVVLGLFTVGLGSRITAPLAWAIAVSTAHRAPVILYGFDQVISTWAFYLAITGASGQAVSLDRFLSRWRKARRDVSHRRRDGRWVVPSGVPAPTTSANLALRLIQLHLCLIYGMAGLSKLQGPAWWNGYAMWSVISVAEFRPIDLTWLASYPYLLNFLTHAGLAIEIGYPILIWNRRLRPLLIALALAMHLGIDLALGLTEFSLVMIAGNVAFFSGPWLRSLVTGRAAQPLARVLYDGACPRCRASMALVASADPDRLVEPIDLTAVDVTTVHPSLTKEACLRSMHVVSPKGRVWAGYDGVLALARLLPLWWPLGMLGSLPGVVPLGRRAYNALAASRPRDVPCTDDVCGLHAPRESANRGESVPAEVESGRTSR